MPVGDPVEVLRNRGQPLKVGPALFGVADPDHGQHGEQACRGGDEEVADGELDESRVDLVEARLRMAHEHIHRGALLLPSRVDRPRALQEPLQRGTLFPLGFLAHVTQAGTCGPHTEHRRPQRIDVEQELDELVGQRGDCGHGDSLLSDYASSRGRD